MAVSEVDLDWVSDLRYNMLIALTENRRGLRTSELAEEVGKSDSTVVKSVKALKKRGLVRQDDHSVYYATWRAMAVTRYLEDAAKAIQDSAQTSQAEDGGDTQ